MHTSFYFLLHFVLLYYYIIEQRFWGAYIVLASAIVQSLLNKYVYAKDNGEAVKGGNDSLEGKQEALKSDGKGLKGMRRCWETKKRR